MMSDTEKTNNTKQNNGAAQGGVQNNGQRHGHHGNRHGHHGGQKPSRQNVSELEAEIAEGIASAHAAEDGTRKPQNNRPRSNGNNRHAGNKPQGGVPQGNPAQNNRNQGGKSRRTDRQDGAEFQNKKQGDAPQGQDSRRGRQDRNNRRRNDRKKDAPLTETALPQSLETESFLSSKEDAFFAPAAAEDDSILDTMPPDPTLDAVFADPVQAPEPNEGTEIVGIHFPQGGKVYYFDPAGTVFPEGSAAIVETARGLELGNVAIPNRKVPDRSIVQPLKPVIRMATKEDLEHAAQNTAKEKDALAVCKKKVEAHRLDMKLTGAQYTFDNQKLIFYFTAAQRVDFRELVKDLATTFHTRIELRQIGTRDEAKMMGGFGMCGRALCCATFLPNYCQSTIKMAKHQGLALNSGKISGICGRLMCCLKYEESTYEQELALMPTVGSLVDTADGKGVVTDVRPVGYTLKVKLEEKPDAAPKSFQLAEIKVLNRADAPREEDGGDTDEEN